MPKAGKGKHTERQMAQADRTRQALELRKAGATFQSIADQLGWADASGAYRAVAKAMEAMIAEPAQELRSVQYERLNHMLLTLWPRVQQGELAAMDRAVSIMDRINALWGLNAPQMSMHQGQTDVVIIDGSKSDYIEGLKAARQGAMAQHVIDATASEPSDD